MSLLGTTIGRIQILAELARGGCGEVYVGFDQKLQRQVAVKALRSRYRLDENRKARFLREARLLSQLNHVNICQIHDYIESEDVDILVLELIDGEDLETAIEKRLDKGQKDRIAEELVSVLAIAHERGVIHRDLKPSNIMRARTGETKVLDFGLARKQFDSEDTTLSIDTDDKGATVEWIQHTDSLHTRLGAVVGTLGYMSPEQARGETATTASDIYSLGLVLQHLFTGKRPTDSDLPREEQLARAARAETHPVEGLDHDLTGLINRLKAPRPGVRPTARDIEARLSWIRGKPRRRIRRALQIGAFVVLLLTLLVVGYQASRISEEAKRANREARTAERVSSFLVGLFELSDPSESLGGTITAREILDEGARRAKQDLEAEPLVQSTMLTTIGSVYGNLGLYKESRDLIEEALKERQGLLGNNHLEVAASHCRLGSVFRSLGQFEESIEHYSECVRIRDLHLGKSSSLTADALEQTAWTLLERGDMVDAYSYQQQALEIRRGLSEEDEIDIGNSLSGLSTILMELAETKGDSSYSDEGLKAAREALEISRRAYGDLHPNVALKTNNLAFWLARRSELAEAEALYRTALADKKEIYGINHPAVATTMANLSSLLSKLGDFREAEELALSALEIRRVYFPAEHWRIAQAQTILGECLVGLGRYEEAERLLVGGYRLLQGEIGAESVPTSEARERLVALYEAWNRPEEARKLRDRQTRDRPLDSPEDG